MVTHCRAQGMASESPTARQVCVYVFASAGSSVTPMLHLRRTFVQLVRAKTTSLFR
jgi:hypothetical protein